MTAPVKARMIRALLSRPDPLDRWRARGAGLLTGQSPTLELYFETGDPHSHLCAQWLRTHGDRLRCPVKILPVPASSAADYPEADKQRAFALRDAIQTAPALGLDFNPEARLPAPERCATAANVLASQASSLKDFLRAEAQLFPSLFGPEAAHAVHARPSAEVLAPLHRNAARRARLGHYLPAMWQYDGQWFWALDRMHHLHPLLQRDDGLRGSAPLVEFKSAQASLPSEPPADGEPVEVFFSFRSPYSYLAVEALAERAADWPRPIRLRPVLPMAMRGMTISRNKRMYIARDVYREAAHRGLPFGLIADPIGAGAQRCLRTFTLCADADQELAFCREAARAVWTEAIDVATDAGLATVAERAGLSPQDALDIQSDDSRLEYAENNRQALLDAGFWGVPTFRIGPLATWGNDRLWLVDEYLRRHAQL